VNFENFVLFTIALRSSLDITKPSSGNTGAAGVSAGASSSALDPAGALAILFLLMAFFWFLTRHREGRKSPPASIHRVALVIFCIAGFVSVLDSSDILFSFVSATKVAAVMAMLAVLEVMLVDQAAIRRMIGAIYLSAVVPVGYTMVLVVTHHSQFTSGGFARLRGTFAQPNPFAILPDHADRDGGCDLPPPHAAQQDSDDGAAALLPGRPLLDLHAQRLAGGGSGRADVAFMGRRRLLIGGLVAAAALSLVLVPTIVQRFADLGQSSSPNGYATNSLVWRFDYWTRSCPWRPRTRSPESARDELLRDGSGQGTPQ